MTVGVELCKSDLSKGLSMVPITERSSATILFGENNLPSVRSKLLVTLGTNLQNIFTFIM